MSYKKVINLPFLCVGLTMAGVKIFYICCEANDSIRLFSVIYFFILLCSFIFSIGLLLHRGDLSRLFFEVKALEKKTSTVIFFIFIAFPNKLLVNNGLHSYAKLFLIITLNILSHFSRTVEMVLIVYIFLICLFTSLALCYEQFTRCNALFHRFVLAGQKNEKLRDEVVLFFFGNPGSNGQNAAAFVLLGAVIAKVPDVVSGIESLTKTALDVHSSELDRWNAEKHNYLTRLPHATDEEVRQHLKINIEDQSPGFILRRGGSLSELFKSAEVQPPLHAGQFEYFAHKGSRLVFVTPPNMGSYSDGSTLKLFRTKIGCSKLVEITADGPEAAMRYGALIGKANGGMEGAALGAKLGAEGVDLAQIGRMTAALNGMQHSMPGSFVPSAKGPVSTSSFIETNDNVLSNYFHLFFEYA
jgi:hypothetical protein